MSIQHIDARDVLDANARTAVPFRARIVGHFRRTGPNSWDDYVFQAVENGETVDVFAGVAIQVESDRAEFRMRQHGEVERFVWEPVEGEGCEPDARSRFLAECCRAFSEDQGVGAAAVIASKLTSTPPKPSLD
ncbi:MAG: hypothetical protein U1E66_09950 [Rhodospirillales bacterium]